jgi:hypothetical protein
MKKLGIIAIVASLFILSSCGTQKAMNQMMQQMQQQQLQMNQLQQANQQLYMQQQQYQQQAQQQQMQNQYQQNRYQNMQGQYQQAQQFNQQQFAQDVLRMEQQKMANENPCQYLSMMWDNDIRGYGEATGFDEEAAYAQACYNAQTELNAIMNLWASDFSRRTSLAVSKNASQTQERVFQQDQIRFSEGDLRGVKILLVKYEKRSAGVVCRVCASLDAKAATDALLSQAEVQGAIDNAERFREEADKAREEIRLMRTGTNAELQRQQAQQNMQMQMNDQQFQQNQQSIQQQQNYNLQQDQQYYNYQLQQNQQNNMYNQQQQYFPPAQQYQY